MENLPFKANLNWAQLIGIVASILVLLTGGKVNLDLATQGDIVMVIQGLVAIYTWIVHTFINHPDNQVKAEVMAKKAVAAVKGAAPMLVAFCCMMVVLGSLSACSIIGGMTPQDDLIATEALFATAEATYDAICSVNQPPSFCTDPQSAANYAKAKQVLEAAFQTAQAAINASNGISSASIAQLLAAVQNDWNTFNNIVNTTKAKAARQGIVFR